MSGRKVESRKRSSARVKFDRVDLELIKLLVEEPRRSQRALAKEVGLSAPAVADRISRLESAGAITGYTAQIDLAVLGYGLTVYVEVSRDLGPDHRELSKRMAEIEEVERVILTTGEYDLMLKVNVTDRDHLNDVLFEKLIEGDVKISHSNTRVSLGEYFANDYREKLIDRLIADLDESDQVEQGVMVRAVRILEFASLYRSVMNRIAWRISKGVFNVDLSGPQSGYR